MKVHDAMVRDVQACSADSNLESVATVMWNGNIGAVLVVDGAGQLQGILSIDDIIELAECGMRGQGAPELSYGDTMNALKAMGKRH